MGKLVGKKTGQKTTAGKDVYITPEGERVSEKSVTIKFGENDFVNAPSIIDGIRYTEDEIRDMLLDGTMRPTSRHDTEEEAIKAAIRRSNNLNSGGMTPAEKAREQMRSMGLSAPYIGSRETRTEEEIARDRKTLAENVPVLGEAMLAKEIAGDVKDKDYIGAGLNTLALAAGVVPGPGKALSKGIRKFNKTRKAYKLAVQSEDKKLYPLFVNADKELPVGKWIEADFPDTAFTAPNGKVYVPTRGAERKPTKYFLEDKEITKREYNRLGPNAKPFARVEPGEVSKGTGDQVKIPNEETAEKLKDAGFPVSKPTKNAPHGTVLSVAARPGLHASQNPVATHLGPEDLIVTNSEKRKLIKAGVTPEAFKSKTFFYDENNKIVGKTKRKKLSKEELAKLKSKKVNYVKRRAEDQVFVEVEMADDVDYQSMLAKEGKTDINDRVPKGGSYRYSDGQADSDQWVVGGDMKITKVLSRAESRQLQKERGVVDLPYRDEVEEIIGRKFSKGGVVMDDYQLAKITDEPQNYATGGIAKQMEMFQDGGLMDEGGTVDPVSGNDVPPGSTQEEVRDDIPAQLSEGEFVFPADVVRFIGLEKLMKIRQQAKAGLKRMEEMGQMGNADEAIMPDDVPFTIDDLDMEDEEPLEFQLGGTVSKAGTGIAGYTTPNIPTTGVLPNPGNNPTGMPQPQFPIFQPMPFGTAQQPIQAASQQQQMLPNLSVQPGIPYYPGFTPFPPGFQPPPMNLPPTDPATGQLKLPTFYDMVGQPGAAGQATTDPDATKDATTPPATDVRSDDSGDGQSDNPGAGFVEPELGELDFSNLGNLGAEAKRAFTNLTDPIRELFGMESKLGDRKDAEAMAGLGSTPGSYLIGDIFESANRKTDAFGGSEKFGLTNPELRSATFKQAGAQLATLGITNPLTAIMKDLGILDFKVDDIGRAGFSGMNAALGSLGFTNRGQLFNNAQATLVGSAMAAAHAASIKGLSPTEIQAEYNKVLNTPAARQIQRNSYNTIKSSIAENMGKTSISDAELVTEMARVERTAIQDKETGFNRQTPRGSKPGQPADAEFRSNVITDRRGNAVVQERSKTKANPKGNPVLSEKGRRTKSRLDSTINQARTVRSLADRVAGVTQASGYPAGVTQRDFGRETVVESAAREAANRAQAERQAAARARADAAFAAAKADREERGDFGSDGQSDNESSPGGGYGSDQGTGGGGDMGVICLTEDMKVRRNGVIDFVTNVQVGDIVDYTKVTEVLHKHMREGYYVVNGELKITNDHPVLANGSWKLTEDLVLGDYINDVKVASIEYIEKVTPTVYIGTEADRYTVYTEGATYTVHGQYKNALKKAA